MAKKEAEPKIVLEREYIVPLRKEWLKVAEYKRVARAVKALKQFIAKHMKVEERELKKVKIDKWLNHEMWFRGIKKPVAKIKVTAIKFDSGIVKVSLVDIPKILQFKIDKEKKSKQEAEKVKAEKVEEKKEEKAEERTEEEKKEEVEKEKSVVEADLMRQEKQAKQMKHQVTGEKQVRIQRKALEK